MGLDFWEFQLARKKSGGSSAKTETTVLFEGKPTKLDLTAYGMGYAYLLTDKDLPKMTEGQNLYYKYEGGGEKHFGEMVPAHSDFGVCYANTAGATLVYAPNLGGCGFVFTASTDSTTGVDIGDISNVKMWIQYNENEPYYITEAVSDGGDHKFSFSHDKAVIAARKGLLMRRRMSGLAWNLRYPQHTFTAPYNKTLRFVDSEGYHEYNDGVWVSTT